MSTTQPQEPHEKAHGFRRKMTGTVIKAKMQKTVVVECVSHRRDPLYGKYIKERRRYHAHDEKGEYKVGDQVEITEHAPISRHKRFVVSRLVKKYVEVAAPTFAGEEPPPPAPSKRSVAKAAEKGTEKTS